MASPHIGPHPYAIEQTPTLHERKPPSSPTPSLDEKLVARDPEAVLASDEDEEKIREPPTFYERYRPFILGAVAAVILGWWISSIVIPAARHRWIVQTLWAWFFLLVIAFRFIPNSVVTRPVEAVWMPLVQTPFHKLSYVVRLGLGWLCLLAIVFSSAFGFELQANSTYGDRAISVLGLFIFQLGFWLSSTRRWEVPWPTVLVGLFFQQAIALFVLKSKAGLDIFTWIATLAADFLACAYAGAEFFFDRESVDKHWVFITVLPCVIFFIAFVQMMYYLGVMQWILKHFAWFFLKVMNVSGAEAVVAAASPWVGQGESACLVKPYIDVMTDSELHLTMTSGFSCIAGSVLGAYIAMGVPPENLVTSSVMSIPASIAISKLRMPETEEPVTRGNVIIDRGESKEKQPSNALHAFSQGAVFGLVVAGQILANVLTVVSMVAAVNGLLTWIGQGFGIHHLTIQLIIGYIFYPVVFFLGVPRNEILTIARLLATKLVASEFVAYSELRELMQDAPLSHRGFTIASYALCGFANLGSLGIQIGVLSALAPSKRKVIARLAVSAMICGFISTLQTAGIAGMLV